MSSVAPDTRPNYQDMSSSCAADDRPRYPTETSSIRGTSSTQAEASGASAGAAELVSREQNILQSRGGLDRALRATSSARFQPYQSGPALIPPPGVIAPLRAGEEYVGGRRQPVITTIRHPTIHSSVRPVTRLPPTPPIPSAHHNVPLSATTQPDNQSSSMAHAAVATEDQKQTDAAHYFVRNLLRDKAIVASVHLSALANAAFQEAELNRGGTRQATPAQINAIKKAGPNLRLIMRKNAEKCADFFNLRRPIAQEDSITLRDWGAQRLDLLTGSSGMDFLHIRGDNGQMGYFECIAIENVLIDTLYRSSSIFSFDSPLRSFLDPMPCSSIALASILLLHFIRTFTYADHAGIEFKMASYVADYDRLMALMDRISNGEEGILAMDRFHALRVAITRRGNEILSQQ
ncbi:hypothetical protein LshimejAT787_0203100 [Lyophyllum shimeji]|uniref:DUF6532 domain-containing protein n=1 Tax=Lyophyllum shimeji TaxID=47721 RepID=A0A9P3PEY7_LYOSH|nr:hypothetical protein LshimejAT787_0203100 [Lyophyllum shimeji]